MHQQTIILFDIEKLYDKNEKEPKSFWLIFSFRLNDASIQYSLNGCCTGIPSKRNKSFLTYAFRYVSIMWFGFFLQYSIASFFFFSQDFILLMASQQGILSYWMQILQRQKFQCEKLIMYHHGFVRKTLIGMSQKLIDLKCIWLITKKKKNAFNLKLDA